MKNLLSNNGYFNGMCAILAALFVIGHIRAGSHVGIIVLGCAIVAANIMFAAAHTFGREYTE